MQKAITDKLSFSFRLILIVCNKIRQNLQTDQERETIILHYFTHLCNFLPTKHIEHQTVIAIFTLCGNILTTPVTLYHKDTLEDFLHQLSQTIFCLHIQVQPILSRDSANEWNDKGKFIFLCIPEPMEQREQSQACLAMPSAADIQRS